ncbi:MAG: hypothetical protein EOR16_31930 [Mesorhizobium sp.]|uniref:hypothetical protein n=1 Tax=Mesorhizobium sp. TaxID=1871066 RepID=UPI000FEAA354|nr:hypothetical protein [Mesorhizobium sp.]RWI49118.1 MAG: hypothetical protein EOR16_31930 [Mesorhizobium sp.]
MQQADETTVNAVLNCGATTAELLRAFQVYQGLIADLPRGVTFDVETSAYKLPTFKTAVTDIAPETATTVVLVYRQLADGRIYCFDMGRGYILLRPQETPKTSVHEEQEDDGPTSFGTEEISVGA